MIHYSTNTLQYDTLQYKYSTITLWYGHSADLAAHSLLACNIMQCWLATSRTHPPANKTKVLRAHTTTLKLHYYHSVTMVKQQNERHTQKKAHIQLATTRNVWIRCVIPWLAWVDTQCVDTLAGTGVDA
jgi:hypothetical protein